MRRHRIAAARRGGQEGFVLALGLLILAALALIGSAALSTSSFQKDLSNNSRAAHQTYYAASLALSEALWQMSFDKPEDRDLQYLTGHYSEGSWRRPGVCGPATRTECVNFTVEVALRSVGNPPAGFGLGQIKTYYYEVVATAWSSFSGNRKVLSVYVAKPYPINYGSGGSGGGS